jgi:hypothetical protein
MLNCVNVAWSGKEVTIQPQDKKMSFSLPHQEVFLSTKSPKTTFK